VGFGGDGAGEDDIFERKQPDYIFTQGLTSPDTPSVLMLIPRGITPLTTCRWSLISASLHDAEYTL
jgi:hypothetical protein